MIKGLQQTLEQQQQALGISTHRENIRPSDRKDNILHIVRFILGLPDTGSQDDPSVCRCAAERRTHLLVIGDGKCIYIFDRHEETAKSETRSLICYNSTPSDVKAMERRYSSNEMKVNWLHCMGYVGSRPRRGLTSMAFVMEDLGLRWGVGVSRR